MSNDETLIRQYAGCRGDGAPVLEALARVVAAAEARGYARAKEQAAELADGGALYVRGVLMTPSERIRAMKDEGGESRCRGCGHADHDDNACGACRPGQCIRDDS